MLAWAALGTILRDGGSWSGHERNCCFLNTRSTRFADVSFVSGLDHDADSRAIATVDWDHDGDLDLWVSNRTAPRVRLMRNDVPSDNHFLAIRLQGTGSNRDAIGARVAVETTGPGGGSRSLRTLRAGEGYLAQSSKWLHFGLGQGTKVDRVEVRWPDGTKEVFSHVQANERYLLTQGSGVAHRSRSAPRTVRLEPSTPTKGEDSGGSIRIIPHAPLPLPVLPFVNLDGREEKVDTGGQPYALITLWATWCQPCLRELSEFAKHEPALNAAGIRWLPINVDDYEQEVAERLPAVQQFFNRAKLPARGGLGDKSLIEVFDIAQRALVTKQDPLPVPCSFLLDSEHRLAAVYKGTVSPAQIEQDAIALSGESGDPRDKAVPFAGRWGTSPFPADLLAIPTRLLDISRASDALAYLNDHVSIEQLSPAIRPDQLATLYVQIGKQLVTHNDVRTSIAAFEHALEARPKYWAARAALADAYQRLGQISGAIEQHRLALEISPGHPLSANNLAWLLSTNPDPKIRRPAEAVRLAQQLCQQTNYAQPAALDTLAAAQAAAGDYDQAIVNMRKALAVTVSLGKTAAAERMRQRLALYEAGRPYFEQVGAPP